MIKKLQTFLLKATSVKSRICLRINPGRFPKPARINRKNNPSKWVCQVTSYELRATRNWLAAGSSWLISRSSRLAAHSSHLVARCSRLAAILFLTTIPAKAIEPVTVIVSLTPPYTPFLHEYASSGINKLQVTLIVNDSRLINHPVKVQMLIEKLNSGIVMRTSEYASIPPVLLNGQSTEILQGADLTAYFMAQNNIFQGSLQTQYIQTGRIPDGQYRIGFRVVDAQRTEVALSATTYSQYGWFVLNDPPQLNLPRHNSTERVNDPQSIKLEWFPKHLGSMNSAFAANYKVELFAIRVPGMEPNQVAMSALPDYTEITNQTRLFITNDKYVLEPGVKYAWRVKAYAEEGFTLFQNDGYSEVFSFKYGSSCPTPQNVRSNVLSPEQAAIGWDKDPLQTSYKVRYRAAWGADAPWHNAESYLDNYTISNTLMPEHKYEYQVMAFCNKVGSEYSQIATFTTPASPMDKYVCGNADIVSVTNNVPKPILEVGEIIYNGKFPVKITEVSGSNGVFTGKGRMRVPFLNNIQVNMKFTNLKVNELNQVTGGEMVSEYNPTSKWLREEVLSSRDNGQDNDSEIASNGGNNESSVLLTSTVDTIIKSPNGNVLIISVNGDTTNIIMTPEGKIVALTSSGDTLASSTEPMAISDATGKELTVDKSGNITELAEIAVSNSSEISDKLKFIIDKTDYFDKGSYYTIYNNKKIEIKIEKVDANVNLDLTQVKWKLAGKDIASKANAPNVIELCINTANLPRYINNLSVTNGSGKTLVNLKIRTYFAPIVKFDEKDEFKGEYFFDHGYEFESIKKTYNTFKVGKEQETYYVPVMGLNIWKTAIIKVTVNDFMDNGVADGNFKIVFKPDKPDKLKINNQDSLILNGTELNKLSSISIEAKNFVDNTDSKALTPMFINVFIGATREKVGMLEYYCAEKVSKSVRLIYTKLQDETDFPSYLDKDKLQTYLDEHSFNQLFLKLSVDTVHLTSKNFKLTDMNTWSNIKILNALNSEYNPTGFSLVRDYFYITNLVREGSEPNTFLGGFHWVGDQGGVQVKDIVSPYNECVEEKTAHEFGHWINLPHTFETTKSNAQVPKVNSQKGGTRDNFMDYNIQRKKWLKVQLLNSIRN